MKIKKSKKVKRKIDLVKLELKPDVERSGEFEVKIDFDKASKAWQRNKKKIYSENGFCIGYVYNSKR